MSRWSLHVRLSVAALISIIGAFTVSGLFLTLLFERHVIRGVDRELSVYIKQLAAALEIGTDGKPLLINKLADPRFQKPLSGLYWQIEDDKQPVLQSRSLWDQSLTLPRFKLKHAAPSRPLPMRHEITGPEGETLIIRARTIFLETPKGDRPFRLAAAINKTGIDTALTQFSHDLIAALSLLALALLVAAWWQIHVGLRPLQQIRQRLNDIRSGGAAKLEGRFPEEVQLLVGEVNALLSANDKAVRRARDSAADLAHGLKTPLAVLAAESRTLAERQQSDSALEITTQVEQMRQRIERHLTLVRMRGKGGGAIGRLSARTSLEKIIKAMKVMPKGEDIDWQINVAQDLNVAMDSQDFFEVFGNLLDNARKWANGRVTISGHMQTAPKGQNNNDGADQARVVVLAIEDDGPGVPAELIEKIIERGQRLDEHKTGAGLGLSIAKKILEVYGARLELENREAGGVRISILIPTAALPAS